MEILSPRLQLVSATAEAMRAAADGDPVRLGALLGAEVAEDWPPDLISDALSPLADALEREPQERYTVWFVITREPRRLVGTVGLKAPPRDGRVDIGYSVVASHQRRGLATEAVARLIRLAFEDPSVQEIVGETYPALAPSIRVLEKCGFQLCAAGVQGFSGEEGVVRYALRRPARPPVN